MGKQTVWVVYYETFEEDRDEGEGGDPVEVLVALCSNEATARIRARGACRVEEREVEG